MGNMNFLINENKKEYINLGKDFFIDTREGWNESKIKKLLERYKKDEIVLPYNVSYIDTLTKWIYNFIKDDDTFCCGEECQSDNYGYYKLVGSVYLNDWEEIFNSDPLTQEDRDYIQEKTEENQKKKNSDYFKWEIECYDCKKKTEKFGFSTRKVKGYDADVRICIDCKEKELL